MEFNKGAISASDCISGGWKLIKNEYGLFLGISFVGMLLISCIPCVNIFIYGPIMCGIFICMLTRMNGGAVEFGMLFRGFNNFVPAMIVGLIQVIPEILAQIIRIGVNVGDIMNKSQGRGDFFQGRELLTSGIFIVAAIVIFALFIIGLILRISLFFALPLIAEHNLNVGDAMKLSARAGWSNLGGIILLSILEFLLILVGVLALCVGFIFVLPVIYAANAIAYRQVFPNAPQAFQTTPPTPDSYGNFYGSAQ